MWPGFKVGNTTTRPRAEIILKGQMQRPLGQAGLDVQNLSADIRSFDLSVVAKDDSPLAAGAMGLELHGQHESNKPLAEYGPTLKVGSFAAVAGATGAPFAAIGGLAGTRVDRSTSNPRTAIFSSV